MHDVSKRASLLLDRVYRTYLARLEAGDSRDMACAFHIETLQSIATPNIRYEDVTSYTRELGNAGYMHVVEESGHVLLAMLNPSAIAYMEQSPKRTLDKILKIIQLFK